MLLACETRIAVYTVPSETEGNGMVSVSCSGCEHKHTQGGGSSCAQLQPDAGYIYWCKCLENALEEYIPDREQGLAVGKAGDGIEIKADDQRHFSFTCTIGNIK